MPTAAERKALLFLAGVIVVGASVRVVRAARDHGGSDAVHRQALARQLAAVDSARGSEIASRQSAQAKTKASGRSVERRSATRRARPRSAVDPNASVDSAGRGVPPLGATLGEVNAATKDPRAIVDMDVASEAEIELLPRIGSVLARRIVGDRTANGPFGSLEGLQRVRGVGPGLATLLRERVTFSGTARPSNAVVDPRLRSAPPSSRSTRRGRSQ
jgi:competence protein ComEA